MVGSDAPQIASIESEEAKLLLKKAREMLKDSDEVPSSARQRRAREIVRLSYAVDPSVSATENNFSKKHNLTKSLDPEK